MRCVRLVVSFTNNRDITFPVHNDGDWKYRTDPDRIVVRPSGADGPRHEIPFTNVQSVMVIKDTGENSVRG